MALFSQSPFACPGGMITLFKRNSLLLAAPFYVGVKVAVGILIIKASAHFLSVAGFAAFSQLLFLAALLNMISAFGVQNGLARQIAIAPDEEAESRTRSAAVAIWSLASTVICTLAIALRSHVAVWLTGDTADSWAIPAIAAGCAASGGGLIYGAILAGKKRPEIALAANMTGVLLGAGFAGVLLADGRSAAAVVAFVAGQAISWPLCWLAARTPRHRTRVDVRWGEIAKLLHFSWSFLLVATLTPCGLFLARYVYREYFGAIALGEWIVANRISDMTTQVLGIYLAQSFLPVLAAATPREGRRMIRNVFLGSQAAFVAALTVFSAAPIFWTNIFLSAEFTSAVRFIQFYMLGDIFRAAVAVAAHAALAHRHVGVYVLVELVPMAVFVCATLIGSSWGFVEAPAMSYLVVYAIAWAVLISIFLRGSIGPDRLLANSSDPANDAG